MRRCESFLSLSLSLFSSRFLRIVFCIIGKKGESFQALRARVFSPFAARQRERESLYIHIYILISRALCIYREKSDVFFVFFFGKRRMDGLDATTTASVVASIRVVFFVVFVFVAFSSTPRRFERYPCKNERLDEEEKEKRRRKSLSRDDDDRRRRIRVLLRQRTTPERD